VIYLKPGDNKAVDIYAGNLGLDFDSCKVQSPNAETVCLQTWTNLFNDVCKQGGNRNHRDEYIIAYNKLVEQAAELKRKTVSNNRYFKRVLALKLDADLQYARAASFFHYGERMNAGLDTTTKRPSVLSADGKAKILQCRFATIREWVGLAKIQPGLPAISEIWNTGANAGNFIC
jgi:hypothetical protein